MCSNLPVVKIFFYCYFDIIGLQIKKRNIVDNYV